MWVQQAKKKRKGRVRFRFSFMKHFQTVISVLYEEGTLKKSNRRIPADMWWHCQKLCCVGSYIETKDVSLETSKGILSPTPSSLCYIVSCFRTLDCNSEWTTAELIVYMDLKSCPRYIKLQAVGVRNLWPCRSWAMRWQLTSWWDKDFRHDIIHLCTRF